MPLIVKGKRRCRRRRHHSRNAPPLGTFPQGHAQKMCCLLAVPSGGQFTSATSSPFLLLVVASTSRAFIERLVHADSSRAPVRVWSHLSEHDTKSGDEETQRKPRRRNMWGCREIASTGLRSPQGAAAAAAANTCCAALFMQAKARPCDSARRSMKSMNGHKE